MRVCMFVCLVDKTRAVKPLRRFHSWILSFTQDGPACMLVCWDFIYTLEIIARILREVVNRERLCGTNAQACLWLPRFLGLSDPLQKHRHNRSLFWVVPHARICRHAPGITQNRVADAIKLRTAASRHINAHPWPPTRPIGRTSVDIPPIGRVMVLSLFPMFCDGSE